MSTIAALQKAGSSNSGLQVLEDLSQNARAIWRKEDRHGKIATKNQ